jgi:hypothetical protein
VDLEADPDRLGGLGLRKPDITGPWSKPAGKGCTGRGNAFQYRPAWKRILAILFIGHGVSPLQNPHCSGNPQAAQTPWQPVFFASTLVLGLRGVKQALA